MDDFILPNGFLFERLFVDAFDQYGDSFSREMIEDAVERACDFFHIEYPEIVETERLTGVYTHDVSSLSDDVLVYNVVQLKDLGIDGRDCLDLVMTHEATHRMLQGMGLDFNAYQEELCGDYMPGVRAGLNGIDISQMAEVYTNMPEDVEHPDGGLRLVALEEGANFAHEYMAEHGEPPTFEACLSHFEHDVLPKIGALQSHVGEGADLHPWNDIHAYQETALNEMNDQEVIAEHYEHAIEEKLNAGLSAELEIEHHREAMKHYAQAAGVYEHWENVLQEQVTSDDTINGIHPISYDNKTDGNNDGLNSQTENGNFKGFIDDRAYYLKKAQTAKENAEWEEKREDACIANGDISGARKHAQIAAAYRNEQQSYLDTAKRCTK